ncbi:hypothetical protein AKO1_000506, partial [Acrasis kona]
EIIELTPPISTNICPISFATNEGHDASEIEDLDDILLSTQRSSHTPTFNHGRSSLTRNNTIRVRGSKFQSYQATPNPTYEDVTVTLLGGGNIKFKVAQDDNGCDTGIGMDLSRLKELIDEHVDLWYSDQGATNKGNKTMLLAIGRVQIPSIGLDVYTTIKGVQDLGGEVLVGRFLIGDVQVRLHVGPLSTPIALPLNKEDQVDDVTSRTLDHSTTYSIAKIPSWVEILKRFQQSAAGKDLYNTVIGQSNEAAKLFDMKAYQSSANLFRCVLFYSYFVLTKDGQIKVTTNFLQALKQIGAQQEVLERCKALLAVVKDENTIQKIKRIEKSVK